MENYSVLERIKFVSNVRSLKRIGQTLGIVVRGSHESGHTRVFFPRIKIPKHFESLWTENSNSDENFHKSKKIKVVWMCISEYCITKLSKHF